ncbi:MAG TPA: sulfurtransferase [Verrucomicrobiales bacterium]|nr:sulfurtransferase [Verrucomicrobiales bacterium]
MQHSPGFLKLVESALEEIDEMSIDEARIFLKDHSHASLVDVREDKEWDAEHAAEAEHLGKGILERDIESRFPDKTTELIMYCGGGYRSALTAQVAKTMGYTSIWSLKGGYKSMKAADWPMV